MSTEPTKPADPTGALAVREAGLAMRINHGGVQLQTFGELIAFGKTMIESGFAPREFTLPAHVVWAVQSGAELGIGPATSLRAFYVAPSGRPQLYAEAALGICVARGVLDPDFDQGTEGEGEKLVGWFRFRRKSWKESKTVRFSLADARRAGLGGRDWNSSNWGKWPQRMVRARAVAFAMHDYFADVLMGVTLEGETDETEPTIHEVTPMPKPEREPSATGDPLLSMVVDATVEPPFASHAEADAALAAEEAKPKCEHAKIADKVAKLKPGRSIECLDCGEWVGPDVDELKLT